MTEPREVDRPSSECGSTVIAPLWMLWRGRRFVSAGRHPSEQKERGQLVRYLAANAEHRHRIPRPQRENRSDGAWTRHVSSFRCRWGGRIAHTLALFAVIPGDCLKPGFGVEGRIRIVKTLHCAHASALSRAFPFSGGKVSQAKRGSPKVVDVKVGDTAQGVALHMDWLWPAKRAMCVSTRGRSGNG